MRIMSIQWNVRIQIKKKESITFRRIDLSQFLGKKKR